jgi:hypothetical protein
MSTLDKFDMLADYIQFRYVTVGNEINKEENKGIINEEIKLLEHEYFILGDLNDKIAKIDEIEDNE